jgi:cation diffusion facilitator family transporter
LASQTQFGSTPVKIAFAANIGIFLVKAVSAYITGSAALFSETLHSLADSMNSIFLIVGIYLASRPADRTHPFGYGKEVYFWSFVAAVFMLGVVSVSSVWRGVDQILHEQTVENINVALWALTISIALEAVAVSFAVRGLTKCANQMNRVCTRNPFKAFRAVNDPTLKLIFVEDTVALFGVSIALVFLFIVGQTNIHVLDGYASIIIGLVLGVLAIFLAMENRQKLIGAAADETTERRIAEIALQEPGIKAVRSVKTMFMGSNRMMVHLLVESAREIKLEKLDDLMENVERRIKEDFPMVADCFIEPVATMDEIHDEH